MDELKWKLLLDLWDALPGHEATGDTSGSLRAMLLLSEVGDAINERYNVAANRLVSDKQSEDTKP